MMWYITTYLLLSALIMTVISIYSPDTFCRLRPVWFPFKIIVYGALLLFTPLLVALSVIIAFIDNVWSP